MPNAKLGKVSLKKNVENFQRGEKFWKQKQKQAEAGVVPSSSLANLS